MPGHLRTPFKASQILFFWGPDDVDESGTLMINVLAKLKILVYIFNPTYVRTTSGNEEVWFMFCKKSWGGCVDRGTDLGCFASRLGLGYVRHTGRIRDRERLGGDQQGD